MNSDYIILIDECGQPYLAHAWGARKDHKYKLRVENYYAPGKHLYLYTDAEVRAFTKRGKVKLSAKIKDKLGWDERSERDEAEEKYKRMTEHGQGSKTQRDAVLQERNQKQEAYSKTLLGRIEGIKNRHNNDPMGIVRAQQIKEAEKEEAAKKNVKAENTKVKFNKLDRKLHQNFSDPLNEKITNIWNDLRAEGKRQKQYADSVAAKREHRAVYGTYSKNDDDFNDNYRTEKNRIGDTDFFIFKNKDGQTVIGEEDMKWVLPEGVSPNSPKIKQAIIAFDKKMENKRNAENDSYTSEDWEEWANDAINKAIAEELKNNK